MEQEKKFYDLHCHAFNLSHPNLLALTGQINFPTLLALGAYIMLGPIMPLILVNYLSRKRVIQRAKNLLSVMENDMGNLFLLMEECIKSEESGLFQDGVLQIGGNQYQKMVLTPLMMDFGLRTLRFNDIHYKKAPQKPIVVQVLDVFNGIKRYQKVTQGKGLFEIYPFLGINTQNYTLPQVEELLDKYFRDYQGNHADLKANFGQFTGDVDEMTSNFFAGIKVYPPLGFNPWPEEGEERKKLECLYEYCIEKKIPITTHCSDGGFVVVKKKVLKQCQDPQRWLEVLEHYPELRINLAHYGNPKKFIEPVTKMLLTYPNVYADLSYLGYEDAYYKRIQKIIQRLPDQAQQERIKDRLIFGTDFMMQLLKIDSYGGYLKIFSETEHLSADDKDRFGSRNAEGFLFETPGEMRADQRMVEVDLELEEEELVTV